MNKGIPLPYLDKFIQIPYMVTSVCYVKLMYKNKNCYL